VATAILRIGAGGAQQYYGTTGGDHLPLAAVTANR